MWAGQYNLGQYSLLRAAVIDPRRWRAGQLFYDEARHAFDDPLPIRDYTPYHPFRSKAGAVEINLAKERLLLDRIAAYQLEEHQKIEANSARFVQRFEQERAQLAHPLNPPVPTPGQPGYRPPLPGEPGYAPPGRVPTPGTVPPATPVTVPGTVPEGPPEPSIAPQEFPESEEPPHKASGRKK